MSFQDFHHTKESKEKISKNSARYFLGKKFSKDHREKLSKAKMGHKPWNKGKTGYLSDKARKKISETRKKRETQVKQKLK